MAGEIEEPRGLNLRADSLHSGSVSFGRFESEVLSWERKSSFSHNRYLEEVEKCSKPGSVVEKKAYFEAHFRKKSMQLPDSIEGPYLREYRNNENDEAESMDHGEVDDRNGSSSFAHFDDSALENVEYEEFDNENGEDQYNHVKSCDSYAHFDESLDCSKDDGECAEMEYKRIDAGTLSSGFRVRVALDSSNILVEGVHEDVKSDEAHQSEAGSRCEELQFEDDRQEIEIKEILAHTVATSDNSPRLLEPLPKSGTAAKVGKSDVVHGYNRSPRVSGTMESKSVKPRLKSGTNAGQAQKNIYRDASRTASNNHGRRESRQRTKAEKQPPQAAIPTRHSLLRTPKNEDFDGASSRLNLGNKSEKEQKLKKVVEPHYSAPNKVEVRAYQNANRVEQIICSIKPETRPSASAFSLKCDERAEKRKEFNLKLEEKMHAKEVEMNQLQVKTQEKAKAEIKQLRKSLNFKATPMPSFYRVAVPPGSDGNKAVLSKSKPAQAGQNSRSPGCRAGGRSPLLLRAGCDQTPSADDPSACSGVTDFSVMSEACETVPTNNNNHSRAVTKNGATSKELDKIKDTNLQKHQALENNTGLKDKRVESKPKLANGINGRKITRKSMKGVKTGINSSVGDLAVGVAS